jgi:hypothetical protein
MRKLLVTVCLVHGLFMLAGCASTAPQAKFSQSIAAESRVMAPDTVTVSVEAAKGVEMLPSDKTVLAEIIQQKVDQRKIANASQAEKRDFEVSMLVTRFQKGNAFARAMLAGLGQIHLDAVVTLLRLPDRKEEGKFTLSKTFAWGGIYGASTSMEDIEKTFGDGVAAALTGQPEAPKNQTVEAKKE